MRTLSVVIPVKDDAVALERCLRLLGRQSLPPTEVVVVDNASTDTSAEVARAYGARVVPEPRPGIPAAASAGYDAATGDLIVRCDADTAPPRDWLERVARRMDAEPGLEAVTGSGRFYDLPWWLAPVAAGVYLGAFYALMHAALARPPLWGSNMAVRRETWQRVSARVHREDPGLHDDVDLAFALGPHCRTRYAADLRVGVSARSLRGWAQTRRRFRRAFRTLAVNWRDAPPWERWRARVAGGPAAADGARPVGAGVRPVCAGVRPGRRPGGRRR